jgi:hypothetical protein
VPLVAASIATDQLLGGAGTRPAPVDALAAKTLVKGEPLAAPAGRADDFAWPRREVGQEQARGDIPIAINATEGGPAASGAPAAPQKPRKPRPVIAAPAPPPSNFGSLFGFQSAPPPQQQPQRPRGPRAQTNAAPPSAMPGFFTR